MNLYNCNNYFKGYFVGLWNWVIPTWMAAQILDVSFSKILISLSILSLVFFILLDNAQ